MFDPTKDYYPTVMSQPTASSQATVKPHPVPKQTSYANVTSSLSFPKKDQAIIIDSIDGITIREYLVALTALIPASSIRFVSRISNARICIYLDSKKTADELIDDKKKITIKNMVLEIKPLITRNKRIVLSNVCPVIPNYIIEEKFKELKIEILSPISFVKIGVPDPGFSHILSFRRQLYISPDDEKLLPESFQVNFDGTNYWIYLSSDSLKCFSCNTTGHVAKNCPQTEQTFSTTLPDAEEEKNVTIQDTVFDNNNLETLPIVSPKITVNSELKYDQKRIKRAHSPSTCSESSKTDAVKPAVSLEKPVSILETDDDSYSTTSVDESDVKKKTKKKLRKTDTRSNEDTWREIKENLMDSDTETFPIDIDRFISLLDNTKGKKNIKEIVYNYTDNIKDLIKMCNILHLKLNTTLKNRCSRLSSKLHEILDSTYTLNS